MGRWVEGGRSCRGRGEVREGGLQEGRQWGGGGGVTRGKAVSQAKAPSRANKSSGDQMREKQKQKQTLFSMQDSKKAPCTARHSRVYGTLKRKKIQIQTQKRFKRTLICYDTNTQSANLRGNPLCQSTKRHLNRHKHTVCKSSG